MSNALVLNLSIEEPVDHSSSDYPSESSGRVTVYKQEKEVAGMDGGSTNGGRVFVQDTTGRRQAKMTVGITGGNVSVEVKPLDTRAAMFVDGRGAGAFGYFIDDGLYLYRLWQNDRECYCP